MRRKSPCLYGLSRTGKCQHLKFRNKSRKSFTRQKRERESEWVRGTVEFCRLLNRINRTLSPTNRFIQTFSTHTHSFCHNFPQVIPVDYKKKRMGFYSIVIYIQSLFLAPPPRFWYTWCHIFASFNLRVIKRKIIINDMGGVFLLSLLLTSSSYLHIHSTHSFDSLT